MPVNIIAKNKIITIEPDKVTAILAGFLYLGVFATTINMAAPEIKYGHKTTLNNSNAW